MKLRVILLVLFLVALAVIRGPEHLLYGLAAAPLVLGAVLGPRQVVDLAVPTGLDGSRIFQFQMLRSNLTPQRLLAEAASRIGVVNEEIANIYSGITFITEQLFAYVRQGSGSRTKTGPKAEGKKADPKKGSVIGHMWPIGDYEDSIAWSALYLRDAYQTQLDADIAEVTNDWRNRVDDDIWTRILTNTENAQGNGYDVGWAIGTGMNVNFVPPNWQTNTFTSSHTHFLGIAGTASADWGTLLGDMVTHLHHHGHTGRLVAFVNSSNVATITGMTASSARFVELNPLQFQLVGGNTASPIQSTAGERMGVPGEVFGYFYSGGRIVELRIYDRVPAGYVFMTKSYGANNPKNGVAIRIHPGEAQGFGLVARPVVTNHIQPELDSLEFKATHGVGINDRTNGVVGMVGNATYQNPTLS